MSMLASGPQDGNFDPLAHQKEFASTPDTIWDLSSKDGNLAPWHRQNHTKTLMHWTIGLNIPETLNPNRV